MLWSVVLFADDIGWSSAQAFLICHRYAFELDDDRFKVDTYKFFIKSWNTSITPDRIEANYRNYLKYKKKRSRSKKELNVFAKYSAFMKSLEKDMMNFISFNERDLRIKELSPFMYSYGYPERKENDVIALTYHVPSNPKIHRENTDVELLSNVMSSNNEIPMFSSEAENHFCFNEYEAKTNKDFFAKGQVNAFRELFLEFASPESLTSKQVEIIRNELNEKFKRITDVIEEFNKDFSEKKLTADNLEEIKTRYLEKLRPRVSEFQKAIDNNIYMIQLKNKEDNPKIYKLYLVLTTVRNIVGLYEELNIIKKDSAIYVRDELQQKGMLDVLKFFLYLKVEG